MNDVISYYYWILLTEDGTIYQQIMHNGFYNWNKCSWFSNFTIYYLQIKNKPFKTVILNLLDSLEELV